MTVSGDNIYEFADFRLIPKENLLLRAGESIPLPPKAFSTLVLLVENHGHLVRKEELIESIWAEAMVEEAAVSRCIWTIRNALGEDSKSAKFIQTVPKRGYKFIAPVSELGRANGTHAENNGNSFSGSASDSSAVGFPDGESEAKADNDHSTPSGQSIWKRFAVSGAIFATVAAAVIYLATRSPAVETGTTSIAVLPFHPINAASRDELYDVGIADVLINRLSTIENFQVRSLSSIRRYADLDTDAVAAGREQKVEYVLASRYQMDGGKIRVTAQLVNVSTGKIVESYDFLKDAADAFSAQNAVSAELTERLSARFRTGSADLAQGRGTNNEEAYRSYLLALNFGQQRLIQDVQKAADLYDRAVELDPNFANAWAAKALNHRYLASYAGADVHDQYRKSMEAVVKALSIDPKLAEAYAALCHNKNRYEYDFVGAEAACNRAVELDPGSADVQKMYSNFLYSRGRFDEAIVAARKAIDLQPLSFENHQTLGLALYFSRRHSEEEAQWRRLLELNPNHRPIYEWLARSLVRQGKEDEALRVLVKGLQLDTADKKTADRFQEVYSKSGWRGVTMERIRMLETGVSARSFQLACLYVSLGNNEKVFENLEKAYQQRSNMIAVLEVEPELDPIRDDPRFAELLRKVKANSNS